MKSKRHSYATCITCSDRYRSPPPRKTASLHIIPTSITQCTHTLLRSNQADSFLLTRHIPSTRVPTHVSLPSPSKNDEINFRRFVARARACRVRTNLGASHEPNYTVIGVVRASDDDKTLASSACGKNRKLSLWGGGGGGRGDLPAEEEETMASAWRRPVAAWESAAAGRPARAARPGSFAPRRSSPGTTSTRPRRTLGTSHLRDAHIIIILTSWFFFLCVMYCDFCY